MSVQFAVQANMLTNIEFFFYDSNVKIVEFRIFFIANKWTFAHVGQTKKLSKQTGRTCLSGFRRPLILLRLRHKYVSNFLAPDRLIAYSIHKSARHNRITLDRITDRSNNEKKIKI